MNNKINKELLQSNTHLKWIHVPKQRRSQETLYRILDATEAILEEKNFEEISVSEIVKLAGSSIGSFYARFENKESLLRALDERFTEEATLTTRNYLNPEKWANNSLRDVIGMIIRFLIKIYRAKRGMLRAVVLHARLKPNAKFQETGKSLSQLIIDISQFILNWQDEMKCKNPEYTTRLGIVVLFSTIQEKILFGSGNAFSVLNISYKAFEEELIKIFLYYLGVFQVKQ